MHRSRLYHRRLRRATGVELVVGQAVVRLADGIAHDLSEGAELLARLDLSQAGGLAEWLEERRERRRRTRVDGLDAAITRAEAEGDLAAALEQLGREEDALAHLRRYLELAPTAPDAEAVAEQIRGSEGR